MKTTKGKTTKEPVARATMRLPERVWIAVQHRAVDEDSTLAEVAERALRDYLRKPPMKKGGRP
jgi:hypothetical protein